MEEIEFKNGIERLEYLIGADLNSIMEILDIINIPYSKEIIELRFGIKDGKEYTLLEVAQIINEKENNKSFIEKYIGSTKQLGIKSLFEEWNMETVRRRESTTIRLIKNIIENIK